MKKITISLAIMMAMLFGGTFTNTADAAQINNQVKVYYSVNGNWQSIQWDKLSDYLNRYLKKWNNINWQLPVENKETNQQENKIEQPKQEQPKVEQPKPEQPKQEQPKVEQPKPEQPKQEQPKVEQPKQEQPKQEQPKVEQPKQEAPRAEQPRQEQPKQEQPKQNQNGQQSQLNQFEQQVIELTNQERAKHGLAPLQADLELSRVAREKSRDLAVNNYFDHNSPTYGSPFDMMRAYGISYRTAGENIAKGQRSPQEVVNAWMNSPGHRANILNGNFTHIGVGYVEQGNHWTQMFIGK
mgnify:CR=1 FL=1